MSCPLSGGTRRKPSSEFMVIQRSVVCPKNDREKGTNGIFCVDYDDMLLGIEASSKWFLGSCSAVVVRWVLAGRQWQLAVRC